MNELKSLLRSYHRRTREQLMSADPQSGHRVYVEINPVEVTCAAGELHASLEQQQNQRYYDAIDLT